MRRERQRGNPRSVPDYDRVFYSYDAQCPGITALKLPAVK